MRTHPSPAETLGEKYPLETPSAASARRKIWIDLENSPHVPFFRPVIHELEKRGYDILLTARDCFQVCELADMFRMKYLRIGHHYGKHKIAKMWGLGSRMLQLVPLAMREKPDLAVSHGSRSMFLTASALKIPTLTLFDYEHATWLGIVKPTWVMTPELISADSVHKIVSPDRVLRYPGIKEDVYVPSFAPDPALRQNLGIAEHEILISLRPPANEAHYHNPESEVLLDAALSKIAVEPSVRVVLVPRTRKQEERLRQQWPGLFENKKIIVPAHVVNGLDLIWASDLVVSGGGTMNREAAALGVPVYSIFRGKIGAVDRYLASIDRLTLLTSAEDVHARLQLTKRHAHRNGSAKGNAALDAIVESIIRITQSKDKGK